MLKEGIYTLKLTPYGNRKVENGERIVIDESKNITKRFTDLETILVHDTYDDNEYIINVYDLKDGYQDVIISGVRYEVLSAESEIEYEEDDEDNNREMEMEKMIHDLLEEKLDGEEDEKD